MRSFQLHAAALAAAFVLAHAEASAQTASPRVSAPAIDSVGASGEAEESAWNFEALAYAYVAPEDEDFLMPLVYADRQHLHFEARYNYEALETGSLWAGYRLGAEGKVSFEAIPMLGGVLGDVNGMAPGYEIALGYDRFELYSEGEYFFDFEDEAGNFFYSWSELSFRPVERFRFGLVGQRTRVYETDVEIQRGLLAGLDFEQVGFTGYVLNLGWDDPTWVFSAYVDF